MVLVDTSVFIDFFDGKKTDGTKQLSQLLLNGKEVSINGIIFQEILQGIKSDKKFNEIKNILEDFVYLPIPESIFLDSAKLYRSLRKKGVTIRKSFDVNIAQVAIHYGATLLASDRDFPNIAKHSTLKLFSSC